MAKCPHTARRRRSSLLNVLTGGRRGRANDLTEWIVTIRRVDVSHARISVWAKDEEEADEKAEGRAWSDENVEWEFQNPYHEDAIEVIDVEEV